MAPYIYKDIKYILLCTPNEFKFNSLNDNIYFTLRDIFLNVSNADDALTANKYNTYITNGIYYEDRNSDFKYIDFLSDKHMKICIYRFICSIYKSSFNNFELIEDENDWNLIKDSVITLDIWWNQFKELQYIYNLLI